jgi:hypothetical protein
MGPITKAAIDKFREKNQITNDSAPGVNKQGFAYIGSKTLDVLNKANSAPAPAGVAGAVGAAAAAIAGATGTAGTTGAAGTAGTAGATGAAGTTGATGTAGTTGATGTAGTSAPAGPKVEEIVKAISDQFANKQFWQPFKGKGGIFGADDKAGAITAFTGWFNQTIQPMIDKLPEGEPNKKAFVSLLPSITSGIDRKLNNVKIPYTTSDGKQAVVSINADF